MQTSTDAAALAALIRHLEAMPPVAALQPRLLDWQPGRVRLGAPLQANINDKGCAFGGSLTSLMTLAGWGLVTLTLERAGLHADVFVADSQVRYLRPVFEDLDAQAQFEDPALADTLLHGLRTQGRGQAMVQAQVRLADGRSAATFSGRYVAIARTD